MDKRGAVDGPSTSALFDYPKGIAVNPVEGSVLVADGGSKIRKVSSSGRMDDKRE